MHKNSVDELMATFMNPTVFTGVKPLFIVAEELQTLEHTGGVVDAVWVHIEDENKTEFSYITKFGVRGKILDRAYYSEEEKAPFKGRLALPVRENFEKLSAFYAIKEKVNEVKSKRHALSHHLQKDFTAVGNLLAEGKEIFCFKYAEGDWKDPFFNIDMDRPYAVEVSDQSDQERGRYRLRHPAGQVQKYTLKETFYGYIVGSRAEIDGIKLKDESYKQQIRHLREEAREALVSMEWLSLSDERVQALVNLLPEHPFESYFKYVKKGDERQVNPPKHLLKALEIMVEKHMTSLKGPMGVHYLPIDNLLYLLHEIVPRADALEALKSCDIIHEPPAIILGFEGKREAPPKFLVTAAQVVEAYQHFPRFVEACERYLNEAN